MNDCNRPSLSVVSLKAFGDFLIAYRSILAVERDSLTEGLGVIAGSYIDPLVKCLEASSSIVKIINEIQFGDVPAAFDVRRKGGMAALRSLCELRCVLKKYSNNSVLLFDHLGWRERIIGSSAKKIGIAKTWPNIYLGYDNLFLSLGFSLRKAKVAMNNKSGIGIVVPSSRLERKTLDSNTIKTACGSLSAEGYNTFVLLMEGDSVVLPRGVQVLKIERSFQALKSVLTTASVVIAADSFPAHFSDFLDVPTFVLSRTPNLYWLPKGVYYSHAFSGFNDLGLLTEWLRR